MNQHPMREFRGVLLAVLFSIGTGALIAILLILASCSVPSLKDWTTDYKPMPLYEESLVWSEAVLWTISEIEQYKDTEMTNSDRERMARLALLYYKLEDWGFQHRYYDEGNANFLEDIDTEVRFDAADAVREAESMSRGMLRKKLENDIQTLREEAEELGCCGGVE